MKRLILQLFFLPLVGIAPLHSESGISYEFSGGRFGDNLLSYLHAKWLSYHYDMPLLYRPFEYSSLLVLHETERLYEGRDPPILLNRQIRLSRNHPGLFLCPYFPEDPSDRWLHPTRYRFNVHWKDPGFQAIIRRMIAPLTPLLLTPPPSECVSIAVHFREGGGVDTDHTRLFDPLKLPPIAFYQQALAEVFAMFPGRPFYCHLFTDALSPQQGLNELKKILPAFPSSVEWGYRDQDNGPDHHVLEDFFSLGQFDVLIHPQSNFSIVASHLHDYALTYSPIDFVRKGRSVTVTAVEKQTEKELYQQILQRVPSLDPLNPSGSSP